MSNIDKQALRERYSAKPTPKCDICGAQMTIQRMSGSRVTYGCSGAIYDETGCHYADGRSLADDHYAQSRVTVTDESDPDVLALLDELDSVKRTLAVNHEAACSVVDEKDGLVRKLEAEQRISSTWRKTAESNREKLEAAEKRIAELPGQKRLIGWRMADYTDETADPALAKNWATAVDVLPIFEGDVNTKLTAAAAMLHGSDGNSPVIPDGWVACSERLPENKPGSYEYLVFESLNNGVHHDYWNVPDSGDDCQFTPFWNHYDRYVTHWMPLPAAPQQEVKVKPKK